MEMSGFSPRKMKMVHDLYASYIGCYILMQISPDEVKFIGYFLPQLGPRLAKSKSLPNYLRRRDILKAETLEEAVKGCDTFVALQVLKGKLSRG